MAAAQDKRDEDEDVEALAALAGGEAQVQDNRQDPGAETPRAEAEPDGPQEPAPGEFILPADEQPVEGLALAGPAPAPAGNRAALARHASPIAAHQYMRTMIPLLLVVGVLLLAFSLYTIATLLSSPGGQVSAQAEATLMQKYGWLTVAMAVPLGLLMLAGAWLFHRLARSAAR